MLLFTFPGGNQGKGLKMQVNYGSFESFPARFTLYEAWVLINGAWKTMNAAEVNNSAALLSMAEFEKFGQLPDLPAAAFHSGE